MRLMSGRLVALRRAVIDTVLSPELVPSRVLASLDRHLNLLPTETRYELGFIDRPNYAYGIHRSAELARRLGLEGITAVEFGVAGGAGLIAMERHAAWYADRMDVQIDVVGFDGGTGLPAPVDFRDQPAIWAEGFYPMDEGLLRQRLTAADLVIGSVKDTVQEYFGEEEHFPVGFVSFDLDLYSSTVDALDLFRMEHSVLLPRVQCYFDDVLGMTPQIGELRAIAEFNEESEDRKVERPFGLQAGMHRQPQWAAQMWVAHFFEHPDYNRLIIPKEEGSRPLDG